MTIRTTILSTCLAVAVCFMAGCASTPAPVEETEPLERSPIKNKGYVPDRQSLVITFENGRVFLFTEVPPELYKELQNAESQADFFNQKINGKFHFYQIK